MNMIDCASKLNQTSCETLVKNGITHVGRYLPTSDWKCLTSAEIPIIKNTGLQLVSIFENGSTKGSYFNYDQGVKDAKYSFKLAKQMEQPEGTTIYFTVDYDAQSKDFANILNYFQALKDTLTTYKIGVYGKYEVVQLIQTKKLATYFWQTYAWSGGQHGKNLHLFQYKNDVKQYGLPFAVDINQVENDSCGGWWKVEIQAKKDEFLMVVKVLAETDIREDPDHTSGYIKNAHKEEMYNVVERFEDWHKVILDNNGNSGWIDGNQGQNLYWLDNPALKLTTQKYIIKTGDSLTRIAQIFKTTVDKLMILNNIQNPNKIIAGQQINVPK